MRYLRVPDHNANLITFLKSTPKIGSTTHVIMFSDKFREIPARFNALHAALQPKVGEISGLRTDTADPIT